MFQYIIEKSIAILLVQIALKDCELKFTSPNSTDCRCCCIQPPFVKVAQLLLAYVNTANFTLMLFLFFKSEHCGWEELLSIFRESTHVGSIPTSPVIQ